MADLSGFTYCEVQFTRDGAVFDQGEVTALLKTLDAQDSTDLVVISHGWNNDINDARNLYATLFGNVATLIAAGQGPDLGTRRLAILGVLWPSKKFAETSVIASGAASLDDDATAAQAAAQLDVLAEALADPAATKKLQQAKRLLPRIENDPAAKRQFADLVRGVLPKTAVNDEDASAAFFRLPGDQVVDRLGKPASLVTVPAGPADAGGAAEIGGGLTPPPSIFGNAGSAAEIGGPLTPPGGGAAGIGSFLSGAQAGALQLANYATYYLMKGRSGTVGAQGLCPVLRQVRARRPAMKLHLVGHSFGGRLVASATAACAEPPVLGLNSLTLLQAAFSHHGFAQKFDGQHDGFFRRAIADNIVSGPVLITYTRNDTAVGQLYPLASRLAGDDAAELGDANDPYGGMGRNGAQKTPEATFSTLQQEDKPYQIVGGTVYNLEASPFIANHGDITGRQVAHALLSSIATT
jgi:hypothetical protein